MPRPPISSTCADCGTALVPSAAIVHAHTFTNDRGTKMFASVRVERLCRACAGQQVRRLLRSRERRQFGKE